MKKFLKKQTENIAANKKRAFGAAAKGSFFSYLREKNHFTTSSLSASLISLKTEITGATFLPLILRSI